MFKDVPMRRQPVKKPTVEQLEKDIEEAAMALSQESLATAIDFTAAEVEENLRQPEPILDDSIKLVADKREKLGAAITRLTGLLTVLGEELRQARAADKALGQALKDMQAAVDPKKGKEKVDG